MKTTTMHALFAMTVLMCVLAVPRSVQAQETHRKPDGAPVCATGGTR